MQDVLSPVPTVCSPLSYVENAKGKLRLAIDLGYINGECKTRPNQLLSNGGDDL